MNQISNQDFSDVRFLTVSALNRYISYKFEKDIHLQEVYLQGEISNFKQSGKHFYFSIKDEYSEISAMMFYPDTLRLKFKPQDGTMVQVVGKVQTYEKRGTYSIIVRRMAEAGIGLLYQHFLELKEQLQTEGLFDEKYKKPLPNYPMRVAIITAPTGDAIHDIISTFNRRLPFATLVLYPALVQGKEAPQDLMRALQEVYARGTEEVLIIGRGGGSYEDLSCFNDEKLARTLFASPIPTVSAIGHESDYTICDFVSSYRAPTPTGAAMALTKDKREVYNHVHHLGERLQQASIHILKGKMQAWQRLSSSYGMVNFGEIINSYVQKYNHWDVRLKATSPLKIMAERFHSVELFEKRLHQAMTHFLVNRELLISSKQASLRKDIILDKICHHKQQLESWEQRMNASLTNKVDQASQWLDNLIDKAILLNPFNIMKKGYSMVFQDDKLKVTAESIDPAKTITIRMADGKVDATVTSIKKWEEE